MSAPVKKCEVCDSTGSKSREIRGDLDCTSCDSATERMVMRKKLGLTWGDDDAWRAYQLGKAAAQPKEDIERPTDYDIIMMACEIALQDDVWEINDADLIPFVRRCIAAAAPVVPVAAQPVVQQEPVLWYDASAAPYEDQGSLPTSQGEARQIAILGSTKGPFGTYTTPLYANLQHANIKPIAWGLMAICDPEVTADPELADYWKRKGRNVTDLYAAPSLEAQPAGEVERDAALIDAVGKLIKAKGRYHTEKNYAAVVAAYDAAMAKGGKA